MSSIFGVTASVQQHFRSGINWSEHHCRLLVKGLESAEA